MDIIIKPKTLSGILPAISSKSDVHRALFASALAKGQSKIKFNILSDDITASINALKSLGADITLCESEENGKRIFTACVNQIKMKTAAPEIFCGECGTTARFILPVASALYGESLITGTGSLVTRPNDALCKCLGEHGTSTSAPTLPIKTSGRLKSGIFEIAADISSQYISGLLFALPLLDGDSEIRLVGNAESVGYLEMTLDTLTRHGIKIEKTNGGFYVFGRQEYQPIEDYTAESDWSNSAVFLCAGAFSNEIRMTELSPRSRQRDKDIFRILSKLGCEVNILGSLFGQGANKTIDLHIAKKALRPFEINGADIPDIVPLLATLATAIEGRCVISGAARLKIKESDRIATTAEMLSSLGAAITPTDDGFIIDGGGRLSGGRISAHGDHRIVMCAALASCFCDGDIIIEGAEAVNKSYPTFFNDFERLGGEYHVIDNGE